MEAYGYDPFLSINAAWGLDRRIRHVTDVNEIYRDCDYITVHVPATDDTRGMINTEAIAQMKQGVVILNYARGELVDEQAMAQALDNGKVAHYMCDFANPATGNMKNAIVTPHLGASTAEAEENCAVMAATELVDYIENGNLTHSVNYGTVDMGALAPGCARLGIFHENAQGYIGKISSIVANSNLNIENMQNKSHGKNAYTLLEVSGQFDDKVVEELRAIEGVRRVRFIPAK